MGSKIFLLKPNTTTIGGTDIGSAGALASFTSSTITAKSNMYANVITENSGGIRSDWLYITRGSYSYFYKILSVTNANPSVFTLEGNLNGMGFLEDDVIQVKSAVSASCNWTDPTTITYIEIQSESYAEQDSNELQITKFTNRGSVIINLAKYNNTSAFSNWFVGNLDSDQKGTIHTSYNLKRALDYIIGYWPSTTPKYCILFRYNPYGYASTAVNPGSEDKSEYQWRSTTYSQKRVVILKKSKEEDSFGNLTIRQLALEVI